MFYSIAYKNNNLHTTATHNEPFWAEYNKLKPQSVKKSNTALY